jgi:hypothetical protein
MGAQLVGRAIAFAAMNDLKPNEYRLLIFMALTALDTDQPPRYFASREESAFGLGRRVADGHTTDPDEIAARDAAFKAVKLAVQGLVKCGAIERLQRGRSGRRAEFAVTFRGTKSVPLKGTESVPLRGTKSVPAGVRNPSPQGTTDEPQEELGRRTPRFTEASHLQPVDNSDERRSA